MADTTAVFSAHDVAAYILQHCGKMTAMKLQKLVYYCQAWSLVWDERPMFAEPVEAWANGPVIPALYEVHRGLFCLDRWPAEAHPERLDADAVETIDAVLEYYAHRSAQWLSDLTHSEDPWKNAREGVADDERSHRVIELCAMCEYYGSL